MWACGFYGESVNVTLFLNMTGNRMDHKVEIRIPAELRRYACDLSLVPNTAHTRLSVSENSRKVKHVKKPQSYPDHQDRFDDCEQVLRGLSLSGRCYWEAEWSKYSSVIYKGISWKGETDHLFGSNDKSWSLYCCENQFSARHNNNSTV
ncbi:stonustoxin subunit beta-like [Puntigrus tetrazona]|uniref:stonustoxin subunit beta-like n=1 Tax=Puntigrus tetrazona TaxID=1606681 RepID=UPI001C896F6A|nr:stonustoxin subunit beta-like [Puntigrus tetrazona]XP_043074306.1 stonustoxin subunit beta-like [Puntigrus tetrazona]